jgi:DNA-binding transcriptional LysR family regulator
MSPDLRHLRYFVAVAEELSYTRAATRVNVVPQALSAAIRQLEQQLGVQLLIRTTRRVELTEAGRALLEGGRAALESVERSWNLARLASGDRPRELRIAYTYSAGAKAVPAMHEAMLERLRDVMPRWWEMWSSQAVAGVATGRFDAALARYPEKLRHLAYEVVAHEPQAAVVCARHRLAEHERIRLEALAGDAILTFPREWAPGYHDAFTDMLRAAGIDDRTTLAPDVGHAGVNLALIASGAAVAIVALSTAAAWSRSTARELVAIPLADPAPSLPLELVWNPQTAPATIDEFVELARELGSDGRLIETPAAR